MSSAWSIYNFHHSIQSQLPESLQEICFTWQLRQLIQEKGASHVAWMDSMSMIALRRECFLQDQAKGKLKQVNQLLLIVTPWLVASIRSLLVLVKTCRNTSTKFLIQSNISWPSQTSQCTSGHNLTVKSRAVSLTRVNWARLSALYTVLIQRVSETGMKSIKWWKISQKTIWLKELREIEPYRKFIPIS